MNKIDWRLRLAGGVLMLIGAIFCILYALDLRAIGEDYNQIAVLSLLALWGGSDWLLKGLQQKP